MNANKVSQCPLTATMSEYRLSIYRIYGIKIKLLNEYQYEVPSRNCVRKVTNFSDFLEIVISFCFVFFP